MSKLDESATVTWSGTGPDTELGLSNNAQFDTLREAILFVLRMSPKKREHAVIRTAKGRKMSFRDIELHDNE